MKNNLIQFYLEFRNDFLTFERFAEYYGLSVEQVKTLVSIGRECWIAQNELLDSLEGVK